MRSYREEGIAADWRPPTERGGLLFRKYELAAFTSFYSRPTFDELLGTLDLLDRLPADVGAGPEALDVGSKNWAYVGALSAWLRLRGATQVRLHGVEVAGRRWYWDLTTRESRARYYAESATMVTQVEAEYQSADLLTVKGEYSPIFWLFPFVAPETHRAWGLSARSYDPSSLFAHARGLLRPGGALVLANHGEWEWDRARTAMESVGFKLRWMERAEGSLHASAYPIYLSVWG